MPPMAKAAAGPNEENTGQGERDAFLQNEKPSAVVSLNLMDTGGSTYVSRANLWSGIIAPHAHGPSEREDLIEPP